MSEERIDIVIEDKVASGISSKLNDIASSAKNAHSAITSLKQQLSLLNSTPLNQLNTQLNQLGTIVNRAALANQKLATEQQRTATAAARLATEQQRTAVATANAQSATDRAALAALRLQQAQQHAGRSSHGMGQGFVAMALSMATGMLVAKALNATLQAIVGTIEGAIKAVNDYQMANIQMAAVLTSLAKNQNNIPETYNQAFKYAEGLNATLQQVDANTSLNLANLQAISLEMAKQGVTLDTTNKQQIENFTRIANAVALYSRNGADERQVRQEISALLRGETRQGDELAKLLDRITNGHLKEMVRQWKTAGTSIDEIGKRLAGFGPAGEMINKTWSAATSSMKTSFDIISRAGFSSIVADLIDYIQVANNWLRQHASIIGSNIATAWLTVKEVVGAIWQYWQLIYGGIDKIVSSVLTEFLNLVVGVNVQIDSLWQVLGFILKGFAFAGSVLLPTLLEKFIDITRVSTGLINVAVSFGVLMLEAVKDVALSMESVGVGLWKGLTGDIDGMKEEFSKIFGGAIAQSFKENVNMFKGSLEGLGEDWRKVFSTKGLDTRLDKFFEAQTPKAAVTSAIAPKLSAPPPGDDEVKRESLWKHINAELDKNIKGLYLLKDAREIQSKLDEYDIKFADKKWKLSEQERNSLRAKLTTLQEAKYVQQAFDSIYEEGIAPIRSYGAAHEAANKLLANGAISQQQYNRALVKATEDYKKAVNPMYELNRDLKQQGDLLKYVGPLQQAASQAQQVQNDMLQKGIVLNEQQVQGLRERFAILNQQKAISQEVNKLYDETTGKQVALANQYYAVDSAYKTGVISLDQYRQKMALLNTESADLKLRLGDATFGDVMTSSLGKVINGFDGMLSGLSNSFGSFFGSLADGFSNTIGRAIVYSENLRDAMTSVAKEGVASLISALVKLGIQYVVMAALGQSLAVASMTATAAEASATAAMWAPAAAFASLATLGANAAPASAAVVGVTGLSKFIALESAVGFESGGYTGDLGRSTVAGVVHGQEFVVNAAGTARNRDVLEMMNAGGTAVAVNSGGSKSASSSKGAINVTIQNFGTDKAFEVEHLSESEVRIIARDEAKQAVHTHSPDIIASEIARPNSKVSKSLNQHTKVERRRG